MNLDKTTDASINHRALLVNARRLVIKVGTGVVCNSANEFDPLQTAALAISIARLAKEGRQVVLVSSGAVTLGAAELGIHRSRLKDASVTRACAAVGQCKLMQAYAESFRPHSIKVAQVLVTEDDFSDLGRQLNGRADLVLLHVDRIDEPLHTCCFARAMRQEQQVRFVGTVQPLGGRGMAQSDFAQRQRLA